MIMENPDVQQRVAAALEEDERTADYAIEVIDENGLVTLKGQVGSAEDKRAAEEIAEAQEGVIGVTNALTVVSGLKSDRGVVISTRRIISNDPSTPSSQ
jgi:osmotically-inducible protein OsmY